MQKTDDAFNPIANEVPVIGNGGKVLVPVEETNAPGGGGGGITQEQLDAAVGPKASKTYVDGQISTLSTNTTNALAAKASQSDVDAIDTRVDALEASAVPSDIQAQLSNKADKTDLASKADQAGVDAIKATVDQMAAETPVITLPETVPSLTDFTGSLTAAEIEGNLMNLVAFLAAKGILTTTPGTAPVLGNLSLTYAAPKVGVAWSATIVGRTAGSTFTATASDGTALTVNDTTGVITGTFSTSGTKTVTVVETKAGVVNSPKTSTVSVLVQAASGGLPASTAFPNFPKRVIGSSIYDEHYQTFYGDPTFTLANDFEGGSGKLSTAECVSAGWLDLATATLPAGMTRNAATKQIFCNQGGTVYDAGYYFSTPGWEVVIGSGLQNVTIKNLHSPAGDFAPQDSVWYLENATFDYPPDQGNLYNKSHCIKVGQGKGHLKNIVLWHIREDAIKGDCIVSAEDIFSFGQGYGSAGSHGDFCQGLSDDGAIWDGGFVCMADTGNGQTSLFREESGGYAGAIEVKNFIFRVDNENALAPYNAGRGGTFKFHNNGVYKDKKDGTGAVFTGALIYVEERGQSYVQVYDNYALSGSPGASSNLAWDGVTYLSGIDMQFPAAGSHDAGGSGEEPPPEEGGGGALTLGVAGTFVTSSYGSGSGEILSITVTAPAGIAAADHQICVFQNIDPAKHAAPTGWTLVSDVTFFQQSGLSVYQAAGDAADPVLSGQSGDDFSPGAISGQRFSWSGGTGTVDAYAFQNGGGGGQTSLTPPSLSTPGTAKDRWALFLLGYTQGNAGLPVLSVGAGFTIAGQGHGPGSGATLPTPLDYNGLAIVRADAVNTTTSTSVPRPTFTSTFGINACMATILLG